MALVVAAATLGLGHLAWAQPQPGPVEPIAVLDALLAARNARDIDTALALFTDNATISDRAQMYSGREEIRRFLQTIGSRGRNVLAVSRNVRGERVTWTERFSGAQSGPDVRVEAVIREGRIRSLVYAPLGNSARVEPSPAAGSLPPLLAPGVVLVLVAGVAVVMSIGGAPRQTAAGRPSGAMVAGLRAWTAARKPPISG